MPRRADFVIIGAMKCATSTLSAQLAHQPGLYVADTEPNFFSDDERFAQGFDWYEKLFDNARADQICGESSTHYTKLPTYSNTLNRMSKFLPQARLIYVMRHPIDRLISQYVHEWTERSIDVSIDKALDRHLELIDYSRYAMQLKPFLNTYGPGKILPVFFDSLRIRPRHELVRICRFVGYQGKVQWHDEPPRNVSRDRMRKSALRDAFVGVPGSAALRRKFVPKSIRNRIREIWTIGQRPELSTTRYEQLVKIFDEDLEQLGNWLNLDITCSNFCAVTSQEGLDLTWAGYTTMA